MLSLYLGWVTTDCPDNINEFSSFPAGKFGVINSAMCYTFVAVPFSNIQTVMLTALFFFLRVCSKSETVLCGCYWLNN
jgi:hypothetical protein